MTYRTVDIARSCGIHPNTVRFYERIGFLAPVPRDRHNYRVFSARHLLQVRAIRLLYAVEWPGPVVRAGAVQIVSALRVWDLQAARSALAAYLEVIETELENARAALRHLGAWDDVRPEGGECSVEEAAALLSVTRESIRNWERNGLIALPRRGPNRARYVGALELARLRIIAVLRKSGHSIAVIHRALSRLRDSGISGALDSFAEPDDLELYTAGDHFIAVLEEARRKAHDLEALLCDAAALP